MTWSRFKTQLFRFNIGLVVLGWSAFWGYGFAVGDVPPSNIIPGLALFSVFMSLAASALFFLWHHVAMMLRANQTQSLLRPSKSLKNASLISVGTLGLGIVSALAHRDFEHVAIVLVIFGFIGYLGSFLALASDLAPHLV